MRIAQHLSILISLLSCMQLLSAQQPWDLFPLGQRTYFEHDGNLRMHYNDSTLQVGDYRQHFFGAKYYGESMDTCFDFMANDPDFQDWYQNYYSSASFPSIEEWHSEAGSFWKVSDGDTLFFYPLSLPGESWMVPATGFADIDSFEITCASIEWDSVFGYLDSIKTFTIQAISGGQPVISVLNDYAWQLGKTVGLISYFPGEYFLHPPTNFKSYSIKGFEKAGITYGLLFSNAFFTEKYAVGNRYKWYSLYSDYTSGGAPFTVISSTYVDSVFEILNDPPAMTIYVSRKGHVHKTAVQTDTTIISSYDFTDTVTYLFSANLDRHLKSALEWLYMHPGDNYFDYKVVEYYSPSQENNKYRFRTSTGGDGLWLNLNTCQIEYSYSDQGSYDRVLQEDIGFVKYTRSNPYIVVEYGELIGYIIGTDTVGNYWPVSTKEVSPDANTATSLSIKLSPNPGSEFLFVEWEGMPSNTATAWLEIWSLDGQRLRQQSVAGSSYQMDVSTFPKGYYIVLVRTPKGIGRETFVKYR